jgi:hypothetical protein
VWEPVTFGVVRSPMNRSVIVIGSLAILFSSSTTGCKRSPVSDELRGVVRLGPWSETFQPCGGTERWWLHLPPGFSGRWTMPGGEQVEALLSSQPKCDPESRPCEPQVAYLEAAGQVGPSHYDFMENYPHSIEFSDVHAVRREVPASCGQKGPSSNPAGNQDVIDWRPLQEHVARCPVHRVPLSEGLVPIHYGKGAEDEEILDRKVGVPFAVDYVAGGCVVGEGDPNFARVMFCDLCRRSKQARGR